MWTLPDQLIMVSVLISRVQLPQVTILKTYLQYDPGYWTERKTPTLTLISVSVLTDSVSVFLNLPVSPLNAECFMTLHQTFLIQYLLMFSNPITYNICDIEVIWNSYNIYYSIQFILFCD